MGNRAACLSAGGSGPGRREPDAAEERGGNQVWGSVWTVGRAQHPQGEAGVRRRWVTSVSPSALTLFNDGLEELLHADFAKVNMLQIFFC